MKPQAKILLTGASGYVGGRLLKILEKKNFSLRCLARQPEYLGSKVLPNTEIVQGDVLDYGSLKKALSGVSTAFYLIHSMGDAADFEQKDRQAALNFSKAAELSGVEKIIYLGGLSQNPSLSPHMRSRMEVGEILRTSNVPTLEFRASIIIGSGSLSFEMLRSLADKLPIMVMPKWVDVMAQPIGIEDLLEYLVCGMNTALNESAIVEIGGAEKLSYRALIAEYALQKGLRRMLIPIPVLTPRLSSLWLGLVTPVYARIGRKLIDSIRYPSVVSSQKALKMYDIRPVGAKAAIQAALQEEKSRGDNSRWFDSLSSGGQASRPGVLGESKKELKYICSVRVAHPLEQAFMPIAEIGGKNGWYAYDFLWKIRGFADLLWGGVGMRRGRPLGRSLRAGDALDFWRVEEVRAPEYLKLKAEMKLPGAAWLEFKLTQAGSSTTITQTSQFIPSGKAGMAYWYLLYPAHVLIFRKMIAQIGKKAGSGGH